ncbi:hypothetical protein AA313_de0201395 [Arthrobotrys entomopaga]|nr:hypothetical protein AA313_de0201395 [Arthrobotrys entomopaga]
MYTLNDEVPEWQLFEAIQPLFASNLQWKLRRHDGERVGVDVETIESENVLDFFRYEMKRLPDNAPGKKLSCEVFSNCIETLTDLLDLLEGLVHDHVLQDPKLGESEETDENDHPKLRAIGKAMSIAREYGTDLEQACGAYLRLEHTTEEFADAVDVLSSFNTCLESPDVSGGTKLHDLTYALEIPRARWEDAGPSNFSNLLFKILHKKISGCQAGQAEKHQAMLRLNGFQLEDNPLAFDMFFRPCRRSNHWQESRFTPKGK